MERVGTGTNVPVAILLIKRGSKGPDVISGTPVCQTDAVNVVVVYGDSGVILVGKEGIGAGELVPYDPATYARIGDTLS